MAGQRREGGVTEAVCASASFLAPLALYTLTAAPAPTWLDSGELVATGFVLGASHPPGHPVHVTLVKLGSLLPLGPLALRASMVSATFASLATLLAFKVATALARAVDREAPARVGPVFGLLGALGLAVSPALWGQAVRPEVYSLQLFLVLGVLLALTRFGLGRRGLRDGRLLVAAALAFGLSLSNHHFLSLVLLPGVIVLLTEDALACWRRTARLALAGALPALLLGLVPYAHLVLRSNAPGAVSLGAASTPGELLWVVSARAFQRSIVDPPVTAFGERLADAALLMLGQLGPVLSVAALGGLYFLARQRPALGLLLVLWAGASWAARAWLGFDPSNPDVLGYLLVPTFALALGAARIGPLLVTIVPARLTVRVGAATFAAVGLIGSAAFTGLEARERSDLSRLWAADTLAVETLDRLPPRAVVVTDLFQTGFNLWAARTTGAMRPDTAHVHLPFVGFPGYVARIHVAHRDLRGLLRAALAQGELSDRELSALAQRRPVFIEPGLDDPGAVELFLLPRGLVWEASAEPLSGADLELALPGHLASWDLILFLAGSPPPDEQTLRVLLWRLYVDALILARRGERAGAAELVERALVLAPETPSLVGLAAALPEGTGRLDVTPFLPAELGRRRPEPEPVPRFDVLGF